MDLNAARGHRNSQVWFYCKMGSNIVLFLALQREKGNDSGPNSEVMNGLHNLDYNVKLGFSDKFTKISDDPCPYL